MNCKEFFYFFYRIYSDKKPIERLNEAILLYLDYIRELNEYLIQEKFINPKTYYIKFKIQEDSINDCCVKYNLDNVENCSQGMKYLLVILKSYIDAALKIEVDLFKEIVEKSIIINK